MLQLQDKLILISVLFVSVFIVYVAYTRLHSGDNPVFISGPAGGKMQPFEPEIIALEMQQHEA